jgi:hypothetical protein
MSKHFAWGQIQEIHEIGPYKIIEYVCKSTGEDLFHGEIDGEDTHESWDSLDDALAGLIVRRNLGPNHSQINQHFMAGIYSIKWNGNG